MSLAQPSLIEGATAPRPAPRAPVELPPWLTSGAAPAREPIEREAMAAPWARRFRIERLLWRTARSAVFRAYDSREGRLVTIKWLRPIDDDARALCRAGIEAAMSLRHPHIVPVHDGLDDGERLVIARAFVDGPTFDALGADHDARARAALIVDVARALDAARRQGVAHRDLKPRHVLLGRDGDGVPRPQILDFGLRASRVAAPEFGDPEGTPGYLPPERLDAEAGEPDPRGDVYALGATLYRMLAGRPPVSGRTPAQMLAALREAEPPSLRELMPTVPRELARIVHQCLMRAPRERFEGPAQLVEALSQWLDTPRESPELPLSVRWKRLVSHA